MKFTWTKIEIFNSILKWVFQLEMLKIWLQVFHLLYLIKKLEIFCHKAYRALHISNTPKKKFNRRHNSQYLLLACYYFLKPWNLNVTFIRSGSLPKYINKFGRKWRSKQKWWAANHSCHLQYMDPSGPRCHLHRSYPCWPTTARSL